MGRSSSSSSNDNNKLNLKLSRVDEELLEMVHICHSYLEKMSRRKETLPNLPKGSLAARPSPSTRTRSWLLHLPRTWLTCLLHSSHTTHSEYL